MKTVIVLLILFPLVVSASAEKFSHGTVEIDPMDNESLQRGAQYFSDYCFNCHSISYMRYSRIASDLGYSEDEVTNKMIFTGAKVGDNMKVSMRNEDAKRWFGAVPPDLSVISRSRGVDWLYAFLRSFYRDDQRPWGVNNLIYKDVAMPHALWELQGLQEVVIEETSNKSSDAKGAGQKRTSGVKLVEKGIQSKQQFDESVRDIVNFLAYVGEPTKQQRISLGKWVIGFLLVYLIVLILLKKEYWKDVH
jgi:ubiquinol-cytochrome c reductase cytochrome c1 subunit